MENQEITIIIPTLNEEKNLSELLKKISNKGYEIIVVDGHSQDKTVEIAKKYNCKVLFDDVGIGSALLKGVKASKNNSIIFMDADCSNRAEELELFKQGLNKGYDFCFGSRFLQNGGSEDLTFFRKIGNSFLLFLTNHLFKTKYTDLCYGYKACKKQAFLDLGLRTTGFEMVIEISIKAAKKNMKILEIPSFEKKRKYGESKLRTFKDGWKIFKLIIYEYIHK